MAFSVTISFGRSAGLRGHDATEKGIVRLTGHLARHPPLQAVGSDLNCGAAVVFAALGDVARALASDAAAGVLAGANARVGPKKGIALPAALSSCRQGGHPCRRQDGARGG